MDICGLILRVLKKNGEVKSADIVMLTGFSRTYVNRAFRELKNDGKILLIGKANKAKYIFATESALVAAKENILRIRRVFKNDNIDEDFVFKEIKKNNGIFLNLVPNISTIVGYAFLEMVNNAIDHSQSDEIEIVIEKNENSINFSVTDKGVGIFNNIMKKKSLTNEMSAIQDLLKGKLTTIPEKHSGEGIFFTSKVASFFSIQSSCKKVIFDNFMNEVLVKDARETFGTKIRFSISLDSKTKIEDIFKQYTEDDLGFSKTKVTIKLYKQGTEYISRSQARRVLTGLDKFKTIILDFKDVKLVGQGFADEVFRVWKLRYPGIDITFENADENVSFMIKRAKEQLSI
ncbi:MAG: DUF4325 domain-containing protein [Candidatus Omnitrophota bacterium]|nr:DUF4325 domain-containing protein [Candidatus Omnitrophota bacterium]